jgi:UPF0755 protein
MEENITPKKAIPWTLIVVVVCLGIIVTILGYVYLETRGPNRTAEIEPFVVPTDMTGAEAIAKLEKAGFVRNVWLFETILRSSNPNENVAPGSYDLSKAMSVFEIVDTISGPSASVWVTIPEGLRKEEIAQILGDKLGWNTENTTAFLNAYQTLGADYVEGVYFPETYLVPKVDGGAKVAKRMVTTFNEKLAKISPILARQNMKWTTALKVASLVQREAGSKSDMPIIAAIIWNRLEKKQRLEVDASIQYAKNTAPDWWAPLKSGDTNFDSPYNTYRNYGLPPTPIANPGLDALTAAAEPPVSKCLYYIHDADKQIHCAVTFAEHKANIAKYLK